MGQYYHTITRNPKTGTDTFYNQQTTLLKYDKRGNILDYNDYNGLKLMEHSWWNNDFCRSLASTLVDNPMKVCWVGDYAEPDECASLGFDYEKIWGDDCVPIQINNDFSMDSVKFLVNNTKKTFVNLEKYKKASMDNDWIIFPISLLTALGNGKGGGDFHDGKGKQFVGTWAFDEIYLSNECPKDYEELVLAFIEH